MVRAHSLPNMERQADPIAAAATPITRHVNGEHTANLIEYLRVYADVHDATDARMTDVDRRGFDVEAVTPAGTRTVRIAWPEPLERREQVRETMVQMTQHARASLGLPPIELGEH